MELFFGCLGILIVIALAAVPFSIWESRKRNKEVNEVFAGRQELDDRDFYEKYFQAQGIPYFIVQKIRKFSPTNLMLICPDFLPRMTFPKI